MNRKIKIYPGTPGGDCTAPYTVVYDGAMTVREFIETWVKENPDEWGGFKIVNGSALLEGCSYSRGRIGMLPNESILNRYIKEVNGSGGWSRSDFVLTI